MSTRSPRSAVGSLIPELLDLIFEKGVEDFGQRDREERADFLLASSLVCVGWRAQAQRVLWEDIGITSEEQAQRFLASGCLGAFATRKLDVRGARSGLGGVTVKTGLRVLNAMKGMQELRLHGFNKESLVGESLRDVTSLTLNDSDMPPIPPLLDDQAAFILSSLTIQNFTGQSTHIFKFLLPACRSLRSLELLGTLLPDDLPDIREILLASAQTVRMLVFNEPVPTNLRDILPKLTGLTNLFATCTGADIIKLGALLPATVSLLRVQPRWEDSSASQKQFVADFRTARAKGSFRNVKFLYLSHWRGFVLDLEGGKDLVRELEADGIVISWALH